MQLPPGCIVGPSSPDQYLPVEHATGGTSATGTSGTAASGPVASEAGSGQSCFPSSIQDWKTAFSPAGIGAPGGIEPAWTRTLPRSADWTVTAPVPSEPV